MTHRELDQFIGGVARRQGLWFSAAQVEAAGGTRGHIKRRLDGGQWVVGHTGVYGLPGAPDGYRGLLWGAHLAAGTDSYVSHEAAAHLLGLTGFGKPEVVLTLPHPLHARVAGAFVHQLTDTLLHEFVLIDGLRVTSMPWTFVDLAAVARPARVGAALEDALAARQTTVTDIGRCLSIVSRPRKPGVLPLARLLGKHANGPIPPRSALERALFSGLERAGEPLPIAQHPHPGRHPTRGCADGCYVDAKLIVETDGRRWHTRIADVKRDRARDNEAGRAGHLTLRFLHEDVVADIDDVVATIRETRLNRLALFAAASRGNTLRNPQRIASA
jgi:hypothetical protein